MPSETVAIAMTSLPATKINLTVSPCCCIAYNKVLLKSGLLIILATSIRMRFYATLRSTL